MDPDDSWQAHAADTLKEGYWLNEPTSSRHSPVRRRPGSRICCAGAPSSRATRTGRSFNASSAPTATGGPAYTGDYTGREVHRTLLRRAQELRVAFDDRLYVTRLLVHDGRVFGAYGFNMDTGAG